MIQGWSSRSARRRNQEKDWEEACDMIGGKLWENIRPTKASMGEKTSVFGVLRKGLVWIHWVWWNRMPSGYLSEDSFGGSEEEDRWGLGNVLGWGSGVALVDHPWEGLLGRTVEGLGRHVGRRCLVFVFFNEWATSVGDFTWKWEVDDAGEVEGDFRREILEKW